MRGGPLETEAECDRGRTSRGQDVGGGERQVEKENDLHTPLSGGSPSLSD